MYLGGLLFFLPTDYFYSLFRRKDMKDKNGINIDFADERLFPLEYVMPKKNRYNKDKIHVEYEEKTEDEQAEDMAKFMLSVKAT